MASLSALPAEILSRIAQFLVKANLGFEDDGICNLRLACRATCLKTQYEFGRAAFSTLRLDFHPATLQQLLIVSKCPAFGEAVKKVVFAHFGDEYVSFSDVELDSEEGLTTLEEQVQYVLRKIFTKAFGGLPNLKDVVFVSPLIARFQRQHPSPQIDGIAELEEQERVEIQTIRREDKGFWVEEFSITAEALYSIVTEVAFHTQCRLSTIEMTQTSPDGERKNLLAFNILESTFAKSLSTLKHIQHLDLGLYANNNVDGGPEDDSTRSRQFTDMETIMRQLVTLRLRFVAQRGYTSLFTVLDPICTPSRPDLSRLVNLTLSSVAIKEEALATLLLNHKLTLRALVLRYVHITGAGSWAVIFNLLLDNLSVLDQLCLHTVRERAKHFYAFEDDRIRSTFNYWGRESTLAGIQNLIRTMFFNDYS